MLTVVIWALALVFGAEFARALPWPVQWLAVKPLSCSTCLTGWGAVVLGFFFRAEVLPVLAAAGLALLLLEGLRWVRARANLASPPWQG